MKKEVIIKDLRISYLEECHCKSPKDTLIFLHGWGGTSFSWEKNITDLSKTYRCVSIDLPGFGASDTPTDVWGVPEYALFLRDFLNVLDVEKFILVGKSFGGRVAILFAVNYPILLNKLILIASAGIEGRSLLLRIRIEFFRLGRILLEALFGDSSTKVLNFFYKIFRIKKETNFYKSLIKERIVSCDLSSYAKKIQTPTLILWGSDDSTLPLRIGIKLHKLIRDSVFHVFPTATHSVAEERFSEVNKIIKDFCL
mgnify:CR=1 FL=1